MDERYDILALLENSDAKYKVRNTYSGAIGAQLRAKLIDTARTLIASETTEGSKEAREIRVSDEAAWRLVQAKLFHLDTSETVIDETGKERIIPVYRYRDYIHPDFLPAIISVLIKPMNGSPNILSVIDEISEEGMAAIQINFMLCFEKREKIETEPPKSGADTESNGTDAKTSLTETATSA